MSSNFKIQRKCVHCKKTFDAKTTVTRFCGKLCNKRSYKLKERNDKISDMNRRVQLVIDKPIRELQLTQFLSVKKTGMLLGTSPNLIYKMIHNGSLKDLIG